MPPTPTGRTTPRTGRTTSRTPRPAALVLLVLAAACSPTTGQVEAGIERELPELIGPALDYDVRIDGLDARSGEAERVVVVGRRVQPENAPTVERLEVDVRGLLYNRDENRLERIRGATATAFIAPGDLEAWLERNPNVERANVTLVGPDSALVRVRPNLGGFTLPGGATVEVRGRLEGQGSGIRFEIADVSGGGFSLGSGGRDYLSDLVNPLVDLSDLPFRLDVTDVRVEDEMLRIDAVGAATGLPTTSSLVPAPPLR